MMTKKDGFTLALEEFEAKHGLAGVNSKRKSIYFSSKPKLKKTKRAKLPYPPRFYNLPQVKKYRAGLPVGWMGESERHRLARYGFKTGRKTYLPTSVRKEYKTPVKVPSYESVRPSSNLDNSEFELNKKKFSPVRGVEEGVNALRGVSKGYSKLREDAGRAGATPLPTLREAGYSAKYVTPENVSFYATRTGQAIKGTLEFLKKRKIAKDQEAREKKYREAQEKAEKSRLAQLELQTQLARAKTNDLRRQSGLSLILEEPKKEEKKGFLSGILGKKKEEQGEPVIKPFMESKEEIEKDYESV